MVKEIILPKLGQTMEEGTIIEWLKEEGDPVDRGEVIFSLESDKATLDVESPGKGFLRKILVPAGETVPVLTVVGLVTKTLDEDVSAFTVEPSTGMHGEPRSELASQPETDATAPVPSAEHLGREGERERVFASPRARKRAREERVDLSRVTGTGPHGRIVEQDVLDYMSEQPEATPVAQRLADQAGIDLSEVEGTGRDGRITKADVEQAVHARAEAVEPRTPEPARVMSMRGVRARIAQRMRDSHRVTAPVTLTTEADATLLVEARDRLKKQLAEEVGFDIGYNDLLLKLVGQALRAFPYINVRLEETEGETEAVIRQLDEVNIALAVDTDQGLLVPVVRDADRKPLTELARELRAVVQKARLGEALPEELSGSTFTITNLGMFEIDAFTPIINLPEAAILGAGRIRQRPAVHDGELTTRQLMWLSLTFDHRLIDGAPAARFLQHVKSLIEEPYLLLA
jgi:pyruvate dehydrogenase E2 component (dihydrolipoamide acetyltransferase)